MSNVYGRATRQKTRFEYKGTISVEDLWDLSVEELDEIYKGLSSQKRQSSEDSLLETKTVENTELNLKIDIVTDIVETKQVELEASKTRAERKAKKEKIMEIIAKKQDSALEEKSIKQLQKEIDSL